MTTITITDDNGRSTTYRVDGEIKHCIIKNCEQEKKICSLRVFEPYRGQGVGTALVKHALDVLKDDYPLVTVPEESLTQYKPFFRKFKFQLKDSYDGYYRLGKKEYAFNGFL